MRSDRSKRSALYFFEQFQKDNRNAGRNAAERSALGVVMGAKKKPTLRATELAVQALREREEDQRRLKAQQAAERAQRVEGRRHLDKVAAMAEAHGEDVQRSGQTGPLLVLSRDGLRWLFDKAVIERPLYDAGLRFREDYELAMGEGVRSCLADGAGGGGFGPKSGPTDAALAARDKVRAALFALRQADLVKYVRLIAGDGAMLTEKAFVDDPRRAAEHKIAARIAFELLARHYGMIR